jgi:hypothetical protein
VLADEPVSSAVDIGFVIHSAPPCIDLLFYVPILFPWGQDHQGGGGYDCKLVELRGHLYGRDALAARYGEDLAVEFMERAVCSECGSRWPDLDLKIWVVNTSSPVGAVRKPAG